MTHPSYPTDFAAWRADDGTIVVTFPRPDRLASMNDRDWRKIWRLSKQWRTTAGDTTVLLGPPSARRFTESFALVSVLLPVPDVRRRDPHNLAPTLKAVIDGLVDAGVVVDDDSTRVATDEPRIYVARTGPVVVNIAPLSAGFRPVLLGDPRTPEAGSR